MFWLIIGPDQSRLIDCDWGLVEGWYGAVLKLEDFSGWDKMIAHS